MAKQGSKRVEIIGKDEKQQIMAVLGGTMSGDFLPVQLVYKVLSSLIQISKWLGHTTMLDYV